MIQPSIKPNEDATQICPVLLLFATIVGGSTICLQERCAWCVKDWRDGETKCAIKAIGASSIALKL